MAAGLRALALAALLWAGCGGGEPTPRATATATPTATATATATPPGEPCAEDFTTTPRKQPANDVVEAPGYFVFFRYERLRGQRERWYAVLDGAPEELSFRRDDAMNFLVQNAGYEPVANAYEEGVRASAKLRSADHELDLVVTIPCSGKLQVRYTVS